VLFESLRHPFALIHLSHSSATSAHSK
jgi:hypothetical protein